VKSSKSAKLDASGPILSNSIPILFSGQSTVASSNNNFIIGVGSSTQIDYTVSDPNGNPLMSGTKIDVTASGSGASDISMTGDVSVNIPDTQDKKYTQFQVSLKDIRTTGLNLSQSITLAINITSTNGNTKLSLSGILNGTGGGGGVDSSIVSRIVLVNPTPDSILVAGLGGINSDVITYQVFNTFGLPAKNALVS